MNSSDESQARGRERLNARATVYTQSSCYSRACSITVIRNWYLEMSIPG